MTYNPKTDYSKLPRTKRDLQERINDSYQRGCEDERKYWQSYIENLEKEHKESSQRKRLDARLEALKQITHLASVYGQLMHQVERAMESEADQL